jgi:hypothetical protein
VTTAIRRAQFLDVRAFGPEQLQRRPIVTFGGSRSILQRQHSHQGGLAGAVGAQDGGVFALVDAQRQAVERARRTTEHRGVDEFENRFGHSRSASRT